MIRNKIQIIAILLVILSASCKDVTSNKNENDKKEKQNSEKKISPNYLEISTQILTALKNKDFKTVETFVHPKKGIIFSPYGFIDTNTAVKFAKVDFLNKIENTQLLDWGSYDGSGEKITLTPKEYFQKFVYDVDFLNAEYKSENKVIAKGNSINNLDKVFPNSNFTEYYFSGFDKKYEGMDWKSLKLIFEVYQNKAYLIAIIHDQWTT